MESVAGARRMFEQSTLGRMFDKLPRAARLAIIWIPLLLVVVVPIVIYYAVQTTEAHGVMTTRRPGERIVWMEGTTLTALDDLEIQFSGAIASDETALSTYIQPLNKNYTIEPHIDTRTHRVDKLLLRLKSGAKLHVISSIAGTVGGEDKRPRRIQIHAMGE